MAQPGAGSVSGSTASVLVNGDWDDIHAAVAAGVSRAEMATLGYHDPDPSTRVYRLRTTTGQPGTLRVSRLDPPSADRPDPSGGRDPGANVDRGERIGLDATVGRFGDPRAETRLLTAVSRRLSELQGVDAAPLSW